MLLKNFFAGTFDSLRGLIPLLDSELAKEMPNLRPCRPATTGWLEPGPSTTESDRLPSSAFLTGTLGLLGGTGGGTPLPSATLRPAACCCALLVAAPESDSGLRAPAAALTGAFSTPAPGLVPSCNISRVRSGSGVK